MSSESTPFLTWINNDTIPSQCIWFSYTNDVSLTFVTSLGVYFDNALV